jgi:hypothetical protein
MVRVSPFDHQLSLGIDFGLGRLTTKFLAQAGDGAVSGFHGSSK